MMEEELNISNETGVIQQQSVAPKSSRPAISYGGQLGILIGLTGVLLVAGFFASVIIVSSVFHLNIFSVNFQDEMKAVLLKPENAIFSQWLNVGVTFVCFFIPTFITAAIANKKPLGYIQFNKKININQVILVFIFVWLGLFLSTTLGSLTEKIPLPANLLKKMQALEDDYNDTLSAMVTLKTFKNYIISLITIALVPAIFEEAFFRGGLQKILTGLTKNIWVAVILTSVFFSAVHFSYFGFLPRFALGMLLGFIFYYSGNIWLNILSHFLNNAIAITLLYRSIQSGKPIDKAMKEDEFLFSNNLFILLMVTIIIVIFIIVVFKRFKTESKKINPNATQTQPVISNNPFGE